jgi:hypothetical protein
MDLFTILASAVVTNSRRRFLRREVVGLEIPSSPLRLVFIEVSCLRNGLSTVYSTGYEQSSIYAT